MRPQPGMSVQEAAKLIHREWLEYRMPSGEDLLSPLETLLQRQRDAQALEMTMRDCAWCIAHEHGRAGLLALPSALRDECFTRSEGNLLADAFVQSSDGVVWKEL